MAVLINHQNISVPPGTQAWQRNIAAGRSFLMRLARQTTATPTYWSAAVTVSIAVRVSKDGGTTWRDCAGFGSAGGIVQAKSGGELTESIMGFTTPPGTTRVDVRATVAGGTLVSQLTVEDN